MNDDGKIYCFKAVPNTHYLQQTQIAEFSYHNDRVMGLAVEPTSLNLDSCSTDKTFYVTNLNNKDGDGILIRYGNSGYTNLELDVTNQRIFLTNESGDLSVYTITTFPPTIIKNLQSSSKSTIRAFDLDNKNNLIYTGNVDGLICIINLGPPGKERLLSEMSSFGVGEMKIRVCRSNPNSHELITGDEEGRVTIWSLKTGKPIYLWQAHPKSAITQMWLQVDKNILWTGGKDVSIRIWQLPEKWVSSEVKEYEENEVSNLTAKIVEEKFEKKENNGGDDSDNDDLNGWNFRDY